MTQKLPEPLTNVTRSHEMTVAKGWLSEGSIRLNGVVVEHTIQPPDHILVPALADHTILLTFNAGRRQFVRLAGQMFDGRRPKNSLSIVPKDTSGEFAWTDDDEALVFDVTHESLCEMAERTECIDPGKVELKPIALGHDDRITRYAHHILHEIRTGGIGDKLYSESILTCFSIHLLRHHCTFESKVKERTGGLAPYRLKEILSYIDSHLADSELSLSKMAELTELSTYYFARQFKQSTGYAPYKYVVRQRLEKAKRLLKQRNLAISQVAFACGFTSPSYFSRTFRKAVGTTPKRYQESL